MKKKIGICIIVVVLAAAAVAAWLEAGNMVAVKKLRDLELQDIASVSVLANPPGKEAELGEAEIAQLLEILDTVVVYNKDSSHNEYDGQWVEFDITKTDGTQIEVAAYAPFLIIDGVGYQSKYESCQKLNGLGNRVIDDWLRNLTGSNEGHEAGSSEELWDLIPMVMVDGELYLDTGRESSVTARCGVMDGEITSSVEGWEKPTKDDQSNFGTGYGYQRGSKGTIEIYMNDKWWVFAKEETSWGITLSTKDETPTGLTIVCEQAGGEPTGELQTGSYYILEKLVDGEWTEVELKCEVAWTMEAWSIPKDSTVEWNVEWEWLYGELTTGNYRIGKSIMDFRGAGDYDSRMFYAEFAIIE